MQSSNLGMLTRELARRKLARRRYGEYLAYAHGDGWIPTRMSGFIADEVAQLYPNARLVLIEQAANGAAIISVLQKELNVVPVTPQGGKVSRVNAVAPVIESGHVYLPEPEVHPWVTEYVNQWTVFPNGKHDDMVDASTQALSRLFRCSGEVWKENQYGKNSGNAQLEDMYTVYGNKES